MSGEWAAYVDAIYAAFLASFVTPKLTFNGLPVRAQFRPETDGKGFSFWHVISEAHNSENRAEAERIPNMRRCERIEWIGWIIECAGCEEGPHISWWRNTRKGEDRIVLWCEEIDFAVVLAERKNVRGKYLVLVTAYCELKSHRIATFRKERDAYQAGQKD